MIPMPETLKAFKHNGTQGSAKQTVVVAVRDHLALLHDTVSIGLALVYRDKPYLLTIKQRVLVLIPNQFAL